MSSIFSAVLFIGLLNDCVFAMDIPIVSRDSVAYVHATYQSPYSDSDNSRESQGYGNYYHNQDSGSCPAQEPLHCLSSFYGGSEYRTFDGSCNSVAYPFRGKSETPYVRILPKNKRFNFFQCGNRDKRLPMSRDTSLNLVKRGDSDTHMDLSLYIMLWGQILDHDMVLTPPRKTTSGDFIDCCHKKNRNHPDCCPVYAKSNDPFYGKDNRPDCQSVIRSRKIRKSYSKSYNKCDFDVENANSAWIDASFIYGSTKKRADFLRTFRGGRMKMQRDRYNRFFPPTKKNDKGSIKMEFGDIRGDSHLAFTMLNVVFLRFHNKLAKNIYRLNPNWNDEKIYQESRKIVGAIVQHITFTEFVPKVLGKGSKLHLPYRQGYKDYYKPNVDGSASIEFASAGFRLHSFISSWYNLVDKNYRLKSKLHLRNIFRTPMQLLNNTVYDDIMRGMANQPLREFNNIYTPEMTEWMLRKKNNDFGFDIVAITVQRGRDHLLKGYTAYREKCGFGRAKSWRDLTNLIPYDLVKRMSNVYRNIEDIDLDIGIVMETPIPGTQVGPTTKCLIEDQLMRSRDGDKFFYTRPGQFNSRQLNAIQSSCLTDVLCIGSDDMYHMFLPDNSFIYKLNKQNPLVACRNRKKFDIEAWKYY
ncbi:peroxidasin homolog pxn-2 [Lepeophtheirus salmonis]|uniref:Putative LOC100119851 [Nasonia vitripennis] n=1 Tax=Lepeophtheirus salmonis TaxID=72036 RepID=A0A0K2UJF2_LEPSM|nr:peroxidasin homolog pxn-2-like [Lepeophtheirus salmonis]